MSRMQIYPYPIRSAHAEWAAVIEIDGVKFIAGAADRTHAEQLAKQADLAQQQLQAEAVKLDRAKPLPLLLWCPECGNRHIDVEMATKPHATHSCQHCGLTWRPAIVPTLGVRFLPGYKDATPPPTVDGVAMFAQGLADSARESGAFVEGSIRVTPIDVRVDRLKELIREMRDFPPEPAPGEGMVSDDEINQESAIWNEQWATLAEKIRRELGERPEGEGPRQLSGALDGGGPA